MFLQKKEFTEREVVEKLKKIACQALERAEQLKQNISKGPSRNENSKQGRN